MTLQAQNVLKQIWDAVIVDVIEWFPKTFRNACSKSDLCRIREMSKAVNAKWLEEELHPGKKC